MKYKVNLDTVWNLPLRRGRWKYNGHYCALGLVMAGICGVNESNDATDQEIQVRNAMYCTGIDDYIGLMFDYEFTAANGDKKLQELARDKYVRQILEKGIAAGLFEVEGLTVKQLLEQDQTVKEEVNV